MMSMWKVCAVSAAIAVMGLTNTAKAQIRIDGAGASFPAPLYAKWVDTYNKEHSDVKVNYAASGSGAGIKSITDRVVQFGATDGPMTDDQEKAAADKWNGAKPLHLPMVAGPEVLIYNLPGVPNLKLSGEVVADIFLKKIRTWNDPKIAALNAGAKLPASPVAVVHRSDGSGTTYIFTDYLSKVSPEWKEKVGKGTAVQWPTGQGQAGNAGVAGAVKTTEGSIGYVEHAYATSQKPNPLVFATQINKDGKEVTASIKGVEAASAASLKEFPADLKVSITDAPGADSYPICGFTYILVYQDLSYMKDKATAQAVVDYLKWCTTTGQDVAADLGYAKLPTEAKGKVLEKLKTITFNGEPLMK